MNEAAFVVNKKTQNGDIWTVRADSLSEFRERVKELKSLMAEEAESVETKFDNYIGYCVSKTSKGDYCVHFFVESHRTDKKVLTCYEGEFDKLSFKPDTSNPYMGRYEQPLAKQAGAFVEYPCKVEIKANPKKKHDGSEADKTVPTWKFVRMVEPKPKTVFELAMERLPKITNADRKKEMLSWLQDNYQKGNVTEAEINQWRTAVEEKLEGSH